MSQYDPNAFTRRLLIDAGIGPGMRVVDLGCGTGIVTRLLADLVGESGHVLGVDRNAKALAKAAEMGTRAGLSNLTYLEQDLSSQLPGKQAFDAAVARRVLMYLSDPAKVLHQVTDALRPGGTAIFQEMDASMTPARTAPYPLHDQVNAWIWATVRGEGANTSMGLELAPLLERCGLSVQHVRAEAEIEGHHGSMASIVAAILPRILEHTSATQSSIALDTLETRLMEERKASGSVYVRNMTFGVWATKS